MVVAKEVTITGDITEEEEIIDEGADLMLLATEVIIFFPKRIKKKNKTRVPTISIILLFN